MGNKDSIKNILYKNVYFLLQPVSSFSAVIMRKKHFNNFVLHITAFSNYCLTVNSQHKEDILFKGDETCCYLRKYQVNEGKQPIKKKPKWYNIARF